MAGPGAVVERRALRAAKQGRSVFGAHVETFTAVWMWHHLAHSAALANVGFDGQGALFVGLSTALGVHATVAHLGAAIEIGATGAIVGLLTGRSALTELGAAVVHREQEADFLVSTNLENGIHTKKKSVSNCDPENYFYTRHTFDADTAAKDSNSGINIFILTLYRFLSFSKC
jgi:hypothetical protein